MRSALQNALVMIVTACLTPALSADVVKIEIPPETGAFKIGPGVELAQANCLICHSVEYVTSQPRLDRKFWEASVKKMREKYAAPIADEAVAALVDYLVATYGTADPPK